VYLTGVERLAGVSLHKPLFLDVTAEDRGDGGKVENDAKVIDWNDFQLELTSQFVNTIIFTNSIILICCCFSYRAQLM